MSEIAKSGRRPRPHRFPKPVSSETTLRARERRFVEEYLVDLKGEAAAIRAGYPPQERTVPSVSAVNKSQHSSGARGGLQGAASQDPDHR